MHEVSIIGDLFQIIEEQIIENKLKKITKVVLSVGEFTCVEEEALRFAFQAYAQDTLVEGAQFVIEKIKATAYCQQCSSSFEVSFTNKICPTCGAYSSKILTGYELQLESLEGEEDETDFSKEEYTSNK